MSSEVFLKNASNFEKVHKDKPPYAILSKELNLKPANNSTPIPGLDFDGVYPCFFPKEICPPYYFTCSHYKEINKIDNLRYYCKDGGILIAPVSCTSKNSLDFICNLLADVSYGKDHPQSGIQNEILEEYRSYSKYPYPLKINKDKERGKGKYLRYVKDSNYIYWGTIWDCRLNPMPKYNLEYWHQLYNYSIYNPTESKSPERDNEASFVNILGDSKLQKFPPYNADSFSAQILDEHDGFAISFAYIVARGAIVVVPENIDLDDLKKLLRLGEEMPIQKRIGDIFKSTFEVENNEIIQFSPYSPYRSIKNGFPSSESYFDIEFEGAVKGCKALGLSRKYNLTVTSGKDGNSREDTCSLGSILQFLIICFASKIGKGVLFEEKRAHYISKAYKKNNLILWGHFYKFTDKDEPRVSPGEIQNSAYKIFGRILSGLPHNKNKNIAKNFSNLRKTKIEGLTKPEGSRAEFWDTSHIRVRFDDSFLSDVLSFNEKEQYWKGNSVKEFKKLLEELQD